MIVGKHSADECRDIADQSQLRDGSGGLEVTPAREVLAQSLHRDGIVLVGANV